MNVFWKYRLHFGRTDIEGIKRLQRLSCDIKTISYGYYLFLCFIKYLFMIVLAPLALSCTILITVCNLIKIILDKPLNKYTKYFLN